MQLHDRAVEYASPGENLQEYCAKVYKRYTYHTKYVLFLGGAFGCVI